MCGSILISLSHCENFDFRCMHFACKLLSSIPEITAFNSHLDVIQHELFLCVVHGAVGAFEHWDFVIDDMLVKMGVEQGLQSEHGVTHGTLIDQPERHKNK